MSGKSMPFDIPPWDSTAAPAGGRAYLKLIGGIFVAGTKHVFPELSGYFEYSTRNMPGMGAAQKVHGGGYGGSEEYLGGAASGCAGAGRC